MAKSETVTAPKIKTRSREKIQHPKSYRVILLNDDYTSMDFVVSVLISIFNKGAVEAVRIMLAVHQQGSGLCGVYPRQIAEAKVQQVHTRAKAENFPLRCTMEEVE